MGKKLLKWSGIGEIILAVFFFGVALISKDDGGALFLPDLFVQSLMFLYIVIALRLIFGLFGLLGKGRKMLLVFAVLLLLFSIPSPKASDAMMVIYLAALVVSVLYLAGALLLKGKVKEEISANGSSAAASAAEAAGGNNKPSSGESGEKAAK